MRELPTFPKRSVLTPRQPAGYKKHRRVNPHGVPVRGQP
jgi:hypothetical protein